MIKKLKIWIGIIVLSLSIFLGFDKEYKETLELVDSTQDYDTYWSHGVVTTYWYYIEISKSIKLNVDENGNDIDLTKYPYTVYKNPKNGKENLLYLCSNNNP